MSAIDIATFDKDLLVCEMVHTKTSAGAAKTSVRISYGPTRRFICFVSPPSAIDWPMLHGDGDYGSKFRPDQVDKAQYKCDITDQLHERADPEALAKYFGVLRAVDAKLVTFVHHNQRELLGTRDLSLEGIRAKLNASAKPKYDAQDVFLYTKHTLAQRKFDWKGNELKLRIVDARRNVYAEPIVHGDICIAAAAVDYVYFIPQQGFGIKWGVMELMRLCAGTGSGHNPASTQTPISGDMVPTWALCEAPPGF
jgi:hypothetical protein